MGDQESDLKLAFIDPTQKVARLAQKSEMAEKPSKMRATGMYNNRRSVLGPHSNHRGSVMGPIPNPHIPPNRARVSRTLVESSFKKKYSDSPTNVVDMRDRLKSIVRHAESEHKASTDKLDLDSSDLAPPLSRHASDSEDAAYSESPDSNAIGELDDSIDSDDSDDSVDGVGDTNGVGDPLGEIGTIDRLDMRHDQGRENARIYRQRYLSPDLRKMRTGTPKGKIVNK